MRGMEQLKEKIIQEGWKGKINQFRNILNCSQGHPPQGASRPLGGMGGCLGPFLLKIAFGLSSPIRDGLRPWIKEYSPRWMRP